ncbi:AfsA-related hotdog domain-containing protein [Actinoplanes sp. NPDC051494]|uniref:AfsA-related hotdog domain-containing protein n=1 Tax=Actinoplanes sp. NPDC051494 TaxID=3363907 RepID=UPI0037B3D898
MTHQLMAGERPTPLATRHLIHRPRPAIHSTEERFTLAGEMPSGHPLFNDGPGEVHDPLLFVAVARQVGEFVGRRYLRVPLDRRYRFTGVAFTMTAPGAWRIGAGTAPMTMDIRVAPAAPCGGIPGTLCLNATMEIDGTAAGTGRADLAMRAPDAYDRHRSPVPSWSGTRPAPADPHAVGRSDPRNVVVSRPDGTGDTLRTELLIADLLDHGAHPVFVAEPGGPVPAILLVEAVRQTSMLLATRTRGFGAPHTCVTRASVRFPADATLDLPLTCTAEVVGGGPGPDGKPAAHLRATVAQLGSVVAEAEVTLTHAV